MGDYGVEGLDNFSPRNTVEKLHLGSHADEERWLLYSI
jgi:hypothetical protein